jgi:hypothetical protein
MKTGTYGHHSRCLSCGQIEPLEPLQKVDLCKCGSDKVEIRRLKGIGASVINIRIPKEEWITQEGVTLC